MRRFCVVLAVLSVIGTGSPFAAVQSPEKIEYDTFCKLPDVEAKRSAFVATTPENRAELVRTQIERWRDANKARLKPQQVEFLSEMIAFITPAVYAPGQTSPEARAKMRTLQGRQRELFTYADLQGMEPNGPCIPKGK
jgi:hypothetical protein